MCSQRSAFCQVVRQQEVIKPAVKRNFPARLEKTSPQVKAHREALKLIFVASQDSSGKAELYSAFGWGKGEAMEGK